MAKTRNSTEGTVPCRGSSVTLTCIHTYLPTCILLVPVGERSCMSTEGGKAQTREEPSSRVPLPPEVPHLHVKSSICGPPGALVRHLASNDAGRAEAVSCFCTRRAAVRGAQPRTMAQCTAPMATTIVTRIPPTTPVTPNDTAHPVATAI